MSRNFWKEWVGSMKKCLGFLLACMLLLTALPAATVWAEETPESRYAYELNVLGRLGIMEGFTESTVLTRGELAGILCKLGGLSDMAVPCADWEIYDDVPASYAQAGSVNLAVEVGYMTPRSEVYFGAAEPAAYGDLVYGLVHILGLDFQAGVTGGYPAGYLAVLSQRRVTAGVGLGVLDELPADVAAYVIYNALTVDLTQIKGVGNNVELEVVKGENILTNNLRMDREEGVVTANEYTQLSGAAIGKGRLRVGTTVYYAPEEDADELLGCYVEAYSRREEGVTEKELLLIQPLDNEILTVHARDIDPETTTDQVVYYPEEEDEVERIHLDSQTRFIYNGKTDFLMTDADMRPVSGSLTLIDNDQDGTYEVVKVQSADSYVVKAVDTVTGMVYDYFGMPQLLAKDTETQDVRILRSGREVSYTALREKDVLSVIRSRDGSLVTIYPSSRTASGELTEKSSDTIRLNETEYEVTAACKGDLKKPEEAAGLDSLTAGFSYKFYLDTYGEIIAFEEMAYDVLRYGYCINYSIPEGLDNNVQLKIFTDNGEHRILDSVDKFKVYGASGAVLVNQTDEAAQKATLDLLVEELVLFKTNSAGLLTEIRTKQDPSGYLTEDFVMGERQYGGPINMFGYRSISGVPNTGAFLVDADTTIFSIPQDKSNEKKYKLLSLSALTNDMKYHVAGYNSENYTVSAAVVQEASGVVDMVYGTLAVVTSVVDAVNEAGEEVKRIYVLKDGKESVLTCDEYTEVTRMDLAIATDPPTEYPITLSDIKRGDILMDISDTAGNTSKVTRMLPFSLNADGSLVELEDQGAGQFGKGYTREKTYGTLEGFYDGLMILDVNGTQSLYKLNSTQVYLYDVERDMIRVDTTDSLIGRNIDPENPVKVFVSARNCEAFEVVIVKFPAGVNGHD